MRYPSLWSHLFCAVVVLSLAAVRVLPAADVEDRLENLEKQLRALARTVYEAPRPVVSVSPQPPAAGPVLAPDVAATRELRLSGLEAQVQELIGQMEEAAHGLKRLREEAAQQTSDLDVRFAEITEALEAMKVQIESLAAKKPSKNSGKELVKDSGRTTAKPAKEGDPSPPAAADAVSAPSATSQKKVATTTVDAAAPEAKPALTASEMMEQAKKDLTAGHVQKAQKLLKQVIALKPQPKRVGRAYYWLGESFARAGDLDQAMAFYAEGYEKNAKGSDAPDLLFKLAQGFEKKGRRDDACVTAQALLTRSGLSENLKQATAKQVKRLRCGR